ncbi:MAG: prepilin-type N-terminal cleavage/methylation domain-containing protein [Desulfobulbaceae bacterium]|nr:prepilin-type N-terminal cleavage/methylation domain-containing protein [Desulfobulbaceae bacterium]
MVGKVNISYLDENGFSLMEVMIALVIFTISFLGFYNLQLNSISGNTNAREITSSVVWASDLIERLLGLDYDDPLLDDDDANSLAGLNAINNSDGSLMAEDGQYTMYWNVAVDSPLVNVKQLRVIIVKHSGIGSERNTVFDYYKSNKF